MCVQYVLHYYKKICMYVLSTHNCKHLVLYTVLLHTHLVSAGNSQTDNSSNTPALLNGAWRATTNTIGSQRCINQELAAHTRYNRPQTGWVQQFLGTN